MACCETSSRALALSFARASTSSRARAMATRAIAVGERLHHLKVFFSNRAVCAQVVRKTDGHVRASTPPRAVSPRARAPPPPPPARANRASDLRARAIAP